MVIGTGIAVMTAACTMKVQLKEHSISIHRKMT